MATLSLALRILGPTLAKGLLESFNIQSKLANDIAKKAIDTTASELLKPAANSVTLSQKATEIAQQMAADIRPLFEGSSRQIALSSREAIVWGLAQTLMRAGLTQADLAEMNFDAEALEQHLLKVNPGVDRDFSAAEQTVYQQAIGLMSGRLVAAAPSVEGYEQAKVTELLQRLAGIAQQLGVERELAIQAADHFVGRYRQVVRDKLDRLEVFGLPRMDRLTSQQSLSMAYITLSASGLAEEVDENDPAAVSKQALRHRGEEWPGGGSRRILSQVDEAIGDCQRSLYRVSA